MRAIRMNTSACDGAICEVSAAIGLGLDVEAEVGEGQQAVKKAQHEFVLKVPHAAQRSVWDCGLACVLMVVQFLAPSEGHSYEAFDQYIGGLQSIWTIDLDQFTFCTKTIGVNGSHRNFDFYSKEIDDDSVRVNKLFQESSANGLKIMNTTLSSNAIRKAVQSQQALLIVLVDLCRLRDEYSSADHYRGHFIVVCGYRPQTDQFAYLDPATGSDTHFVDAATLEKARQSEGTDEDIIIIRVPLAESAASAEAKSREATGPVGSAGEEQQAANLRV